MSRIRPAPSNRSLEHTLTFPPQEHKLGPGRADDPFTRRSAGEILEIDDAKGILRLRRGPSFDTTPLPRALIAEGPYNDPEQRNAVLRVAESIRDGDGRYPALRAMLSRELPRVRDRLSASQELAPRRRLRAGGRPPVAKLAHSRSFSQERSAASLIVCRFR